MNASHALTRQYTRFLPDMHRMLSGRFPTALWQGNASLAEVALTFDDGPSSRDTERLLNLLAKHRVKATFFQTGTGVQAAPHLTREVAAAGHQVALHGYYHKPFLDHRSGVLRHELVELQSMIAEQARREPEEVRDVRPPYGLFTPQSLKALRGWGFRPVMWSVVPFHWAQLPEEAEYEVRRHLRPGSIIVLHEAMNSGVDVLWLAERVIRMVKESGLRFVTIREMWNAVHNVE